MRKIKGHALVERNRIVLGWTGHCQCGLGLAGETKAELAAAHLFHRRAVKDEREAMTAKVKASRKACIAARHAAQKP